MKQKFFEQKKKEAIAKEKEFQLLAESGLATLESAYREGMERLEERRGDSNQSVIRQPCYPKVKFVGGGFAVK